jgi:transcriptional regulator with XRE-family HTH domain
MAGFPTGRPSTPRPRLGRTELAAEADTSAGYLAKLEQGHADNPSPELVDRLAKALGASEVERQHLHDLMVYSHVPEPPPMENRRPQVITAVQREIVDNLHPHLSGYVDEAWNVLYAGAEYSRIYRRLDTLGNVLVWFFAERQARRIMVEWETEARLTVAWLRGHMARRPGDPSFAAVLRELARYPDFVEMWNQREILLGRHTPYMRVRDLDRGEEITLLAQVYPTPDPNQPIQMYLGVRTDATTGNGTAVRE